MATNEKPTARSFGAAVRRALKELGLDMQVKVKTIGFSGFGYGDSCTATILTRDVRLTDAQVAALREVVVRFRNTPGGPSFAGTPGKSSFLIDRLGTAYPFGGAISWREEPKPCTYDEAMKRRYTANGIPRVTRARTKNCNAN